MKIVSIGEVLWDVIGEREHLGGAPFNFSAHASKLGHTVFFVSAVGKDERGDRILRRMADLGLSARYVRRVEDQPTGVVSVTLDSSGQPHFVIHRPAAYDFPRLDESELNEILAHNPAWIYLGTLLQMSRQAKELTTKLINTKGGAKIIYDVNLRVNCYEPSLVQELMSRVTVVKLNEQEATELDRMCGQKHSTLEGFCRGNVARFGWEAVCVTRGPDGCVLLIGDTFVKAPGYKVQVADAVGAGDAFAAAFLHGLGSHWLPAEIADFANRVGALVASRPGAIPPWTVEETKTLLRRD